MKTESNSSNTAEVNVDRDGMTLSFNGKSYEDSRNAGEYNEEDDSAWDIARGNQMLEDIAALPEIKFVVDSGSSGTIPVSRVQTSHPVRYSLIMVEDTTVTEKHQAAWLGAEVQQVSGISSLIGREGVVTEMFRDEKGNVHCKVNRSKHGDTFWCPLNLLEKV